MSLGIANLPLQVLSPLLRKHMTTSVYTVPGAYEGPAAQSEVFRPTCDHIREYHWGVSLCGHVHVYVHRGGIA